MSVSMILEKVRPERLLVIVAHPGDAEVSMGGTVSRWAGEGTDVHLVCCTSGDAGADDPAADPLELAAMREAEQRAAAEAMGCEGLTFLHHPDGALANDLALREGLVRVIRAFRPDAVATADPRVLIARDGVINHVDHREAGAAALDAVQPAAANPMAFPNLVRSEGLEPHRVRRLYLFATDEPDTAVDISAALETKLGAVKAHTSQGHRPERSPAGITERARHDGEAVFVEAAETFAVIDLR